MKKYKRSQVVFGVAIFCLLFTLLFLWEALFSKHLAYKFPFVSYGGTFRWKTLKLGDMNLSLYWTAHIVGILLMCVISVIRRELCQISAAKAILTGILLAVFGFIGAKLLFLLENMKYIIENNVNVGLGGVSFFGTVFFMPLVIPIMGKIMKTDPWEYLDYCTPAGIIMLACIRMGCFMTGCCRGVRVWISGNPVIYPTQLMECTLDLFLLGYILYLEEKEKCKKYRYILFMGSYGMIRFLVEFLRDTPKNHFGLSNGQIFSLICMSILGVCFLIRCKKKSK